MAAQFVAALKFLFSDPYAECLQAARTHLCHLLMHYEGLHFFILVYAS